MRFLYYLFLIKKEEEEKEVYQFDLIIMNSGPVNLQNILVDSI
jgi:hypothetical protein